MVLVPVVVNPDTPVEAVAVHAKVAPLTLEVRVTSVELDPEQMVWVKGVLLTVGDGFTINAPDTALVAVPQVPVTIQ